MTVNTATPSYWLNWRFLLCAIWVLISMVFATILIFTYERRHNSKHGRRETEEEPAAGILYEDEVWKPCLKGIHPVWLLGFRVFAFFVLLILLILNIVVNGGDIFYFYTQWTFTLITIYFGLGSLLSMYGCYRYHKKVSGDRIHTEDFDAEQGNNTTPKNLENSNASNGKKLSPGPNQEREVRQTAGFWGYMFQIIFQMNAGAVILTDCVFWIIIVPILELKDYNLNFVAVSISGLVISIFATMVCVGGFDAHTMLRYFHVGNEDEVLSILKMVPSVLSVCDLIQIKSSWSVKYKELPRPQNNARSIGT